MTTIKGHRISWYVYAGGERIKRTAAMRGTWGYDAECECGWRTTTGGAVQSHVRAEVEFHKWDVQHGA